MRGLQLDQNQLFSGEDSGDLKSYQLSTWTVVLGEKLQFRVHRQRIRVE